VPVAEFSVPVEEGEFSVVKVFSMPVPVPVPTREELTPVTDVEVVTGKLAAVGVLVFVVVPDTGVVAETEPVTVAPIVKVGVVE